MDDYKDADNYGINLISKEGVKETQNAERKFPFLNILIVIAVLLVLFLLGYLAFNNNLI
jgi:hypothetical protein